MFKPIYKFIIIFGLLTYLKSQNNNNINSNKKCQINFSSQESVIYESHDWGYSYQDLIEDLNRWEEYPYVVVDSIGFSVQNRALWEITISNQPESSSHHRIYIHARTHPGEEESFWVTKEIINILVSNGQFAESIRSNFIFHIIPMHNPDGVELGYPRENANGIDIESGWDDLVLQPEVSALKNRFIDLMIPVANPIKVALNMHSAYACKRFFIYHDANGTSMNFSFLQQQFIMGVKSYFPAGFENWDYFISWTSGTPDQYPESWWWMNHGENVMALTYEDMNCSLAGSYDSTANAILRGIFDYVGFNLSTTGDSNIDGINNSFLLNNYPNPFNQSTKISFIIDQPYNSIINIYDISGKKVKTLFTGKSVPGKNEIIWKGKNDLGEDVPSGFYFCNITTEAGSKTKKMLYLK